MSGAQKTLALAHNLRTISFNRVSGDGELLAVNTPAIVKLTESITKADQKSESQMPPQVSLAIDDNLLWPGLLPHLT